MTELTWDSDFERINRHRAYAELVVHNRNWLPWWLTTSVVGDFCEQAERYLSGEGLPPLPVRLWWAYRHWKFRRANRMTTPNGDRWKQRGPKVDEMQRSSITGDRFKAGGMIPLPPGQNVKFIPVHHKQGHEIEVLDMKSGERRKVFIDDQMLKNIIDPRWHQLLPDVPPELRRAVWFAGDDEEYEIDATTLTDLKRRAVQKFSKIPSDLGSFPRPNCPTCATPNPQLHTPLDNGSPSGWGDSFFECTNWKCRKKWLWRKSFPLLAENHNKEGTVTGTLIRGLNIPFHLFGQTGATIEQVNDAVRKIANVAGIASMGQKEQIALQQIIQEGACKTIDPELAKVTDEIRGPHANNGPRLYP